MKNKVPMKDKRVSQKPREKNSAGVDEIKRYLGALAEDFQGRVSAIAEQFLGLNAKLDEHTQKFESIDTKLDEHTQMIGQLMVDVREIKTDLKQKLDSSEFVGLEKRVIALEMHSRTGVRK
ncbi:MAG: hypothetical protein HZB12_01420 [Candidatus Yonathbacteria bacterium]|nr:hypothetical protein [Candidatus Yonathbacteria bacterium]